MSFSFLRMIILVTLGAAVLGYGVFVLAGRRRTPGAGRAPALIGTGSIAVGLAPAYGGGGPIETALLVAGLLLLGAGAIAAVRARRAQAP